MSLECGECEMDARGPHADGCSRGVTFTRGDLAIARKEGADRERRRIRLKQMYLVFALRSWRQRHAPGDEELIELTEKLDAATRAPRAKRRRAGAPAPRRRR